MGFGPTGQISAKSPAAGRHGKERPEAADLDAGRLIHKQMDMDEEVFGFSGADSHMQYLARFTEEPTDKPDQTARKPSEPVR